MAHTLLYHPLVPKEDLPALDKRMRDRIERAIHERLLHDPIQFGAPVRRGLHGYRKLRVGDYRVIYEVVGREIRIYAIGHRREVYTGVPKRLP